MRSFTFLKNESESISTKMTLNSHKLLTGFLALVLVAGMTSPAFAGVNVEGTLLDGFDSGVSGVGLGFDGQYLYVPVSISSNQIEIFDTDGANQGTLNLDCIVGNISYDPTRDVFWGYDIDGDEAPVYTIDPVTGQCTFEFDAMQQMLDNGACGVGFCSWPPDGIDYDDRDDTIRISPDESLIVYNFGTNGILIDQIGPIDFTEACAPDQRQSSGVATGVSNVMYSATNGCQEVYKIDKDTGNTINHFPIPAERNEGMECDSNTFADLSIDAIWVKDLDGFVQAFAVPEGTCELGAGGGGNQPIGGTVGSMSTVSLLVAGAQANMGLWSLALVGMIAAGAAVTFKIRANKTEQ